MCICKSNSLELMGIRQQDLEAADKILFLHFKSPLSRSIFELYNVTDFQKKLPTYKERDQGVNSA